ncbi:MAG: alpha/beta hydrolase [Deltaproteobacteria bacterium]|nr:alpha/beta hydrolase [Deltaproteobacteria bacterium]
MKKILGYGSLVIVAFVFLLVLFYFLFPESVFKLAIDAQRRVAGLVKQSVQVDDHRIVYLEGGKGETVVLLHGFGGSKDDWPLFARHLKGFHLVIPDIPGFGESSQVPTDSYSFESQIRRIDRFMVVLKLDQFHMAGNSMGGALTATYGAKHPEKVLTLALLDPAGAPSENKSEVARQLEQGNNPLLVANAADFDKLMALLFVKTPPIPAPFKRILAADMIAHAVFNKKIWNDWQPERFSLAPVLPLIQAPVLIIWGDQDKVTDIGGVAFLEKKLKKYKVVIMKDTGHLPMFEKPEETAQAYMSFLKGEK